MLIKTLKYDFKYMGKIMLPLYFLTMGLCLLTRIFHIFSEQSRVLEILSLITNVSGLMLLIGTIVYTFTTAVKRFYNNFFKAEGYLTNVLPVKKETQILSKFIIFLVFNIISVLVFVGSFFIVYYSLELTDDMTTFLEIFNSSIFSALLLVILLLQSCEMLVCTAYSLGQINTKNKMKNSMIIGIFLYFVTLIIAIAGIFIANKIQPNSINLLTNLDIEAVKTMLFTINITTLISIVLLFLLTVTSLNKSMDLE